MKLKKTKNIDSVTNAKYESKIELKGEDAKDFYHVVGNALNWTSEWMNNRKIHFLLTTNDDYCPTGKYTFLHLYGATVEIRHYVPDNSTKLPQDICTQVNVIGPRIARYRAKSKLEKISGMELGRKMKPRPYLKECLKELDKELKDLPRQEKVNALLNYEYGLKTLLTHQYPNDFEDKELDFIVGVKMYYDLFEKGKDVAQEFGPLETDLAKELFAEVEKRKQKFSKPSLLSRFNEFLTSYYQSFGKGLGEKKEK